jgi:haloalkane dehalogenase
MPDDTSWRALYPFDAHWFELGGERTHYVDESPAGHHDNGTLLFVHGNPTWSFHWRQLILSLRSRYRCVAPDHLGCGLSDKPVRLLTVDDHIKNLVALVEQLDLHDVTLVAQDWGGAIGLGAMLRMPERLRRLVLFNTGAFPPGYIPWRIRACRIPLVGQLAVQGGNVFNRAALHMTLSRTSRLEPAVAEGYLAPYDSWAHRRAVFGFIQDIPRGSHHPTWQTLAQIEAKLPTLANRPSLLIWGMRDWCFRPDCMERFKRAWPRAEVHPLADVGHWVVEDAADEVLPLVERFLTTTGLAANESNGSAGSTTALPSYNN